MKPTLEYWLDHADKAAWTLTDADGEETLRKSEQTYDGAVNDGFKAFFRTDREAAIEWLAIRARTDQCFDDALRFTTRSAKTWEEAWDTISFMRDEKTRRSSIIHYILESTARVFERHLEKAGRPDYERWPRHGSRWDEEDIEVARTFFARQPDFTDMETKWQSLTKAISEAAQSEAAADPELEYLFEYFVRSWQFCDPFSRVQELGKEWGSNRELGHEEGEDYASSEFFHAAMNLAVGVQDDSASKKVLECLIPIAAATHSVQDRESRTVEIARVMRCRGFTT